MARKRQRINALKAEKKNLLKNIALAEKHKYYASVVRNHEHVQHYSNYLEKAKGHHASYELELAKLKNSKGPKFWVLTLLAVLAVVVILSPMSELTGFATAGLESAKFEDGDKLTYIQRVNLVETANFKYQLELPEVTEAIDLSSLKISGTFKGELVSAYLESPTGERFLISTFVGEKVSKENDTGMVSITGNAVNQGNGNGNGNPPENPGQGNPPENPGQGNSPENPGQGNPPENPGQGNQPENPSQSTANTKSSKSKPSISAIEHRNGVGRVLNVVPAWKAKVKEKTRDAEYNKLFSDYTATKFKGVCEETCSLALRVESSDDYTLVFEGTGKINLQTIQYSLIKAEKTITVVLVDANNATIESKVDIINANTGEIENSTESREHKVKLKRSNKLKVKPLKVHPVKEIEFLSESIGTSLGVIELGIDDVPEFGNFVEVYAIDPTRFNFTTATVTVTATGTKLFKCKEWDFTGRTCLGEWVLFKADLVPGREYTFMLTPEDPGFGEVINISTAEHLDSNKAFISNIYDETKDLDGIWSEQINAEEWVRVTFEQSLTSEKDISIFARNNKPTTYIEVYYYDSTTKITDFPEIDGEGYYKVFLNNMTGSHDTFDLKIVSSRQGAYLEFDHIVDPTSNLTVTACDVNDATDGSCFSAIPMNGGSSYALGKSDHIDAPFQTWSGLDSVASATLYYDSWGTLSGSWGVYLKDARDGSTICSADPAPEDGSETSNSLNCSTVTPTQLENGVWLQVDNNDAGGPESINLDYVYLYVDGIDSTAPNTTITAPTNGTTINDDPVILNATTNEDANCRYSTNQTFAFAVGTNFTTTGVTSHLTSLGNLSEASHDYYVKCQDESGNTNNDSTQAPVTFTVDRTAPAAITNPTNQSSGASWIYWNWTNPVSDFSQAIIYIDGNNTVNTSSNFYNATGLTAETSYTITVHTKDTAGNVNSTDANSTATTLPAAVVNISLVTPTTDTNFSANAFNEFTVNVSCTVLNCGDINVSLDPVTNYDSSSRVSSSTDDVEECLSTNVMDLTSTDLEVVNESSVNCVGEVQQVGIRFQNVQIPQGATVTNSFIEFTTESLRPGAAQLTFFAEDKDNATTFTATNGNVTNRVRTSASANWNDVPEWTPIDSTYQTPDLSSVIQEVVSRPGWSSGNSIVIIVNGTGRRNAYSYDDVPAKSPLLVVNATAGSGSKSGLISTTAGATPFYTNKSSNPFTINLNASQSQLVTFWVNATGDLNSTHEFFAYVNMTSDMSVNDKTSKINITISTPPDSTPPASVTNLANQSRTLTSIYWNWTNPDDSDFSQAIVYIDGTNLANTSNNYYNATGLTAETSYTITVHTKDTVGNVNTIDVNSTASTLQQPPNVVLLDPSDSSNFNVSSVSISCNATDDINLQNISLYTDVSGTWQSDYVTYAGGYNYDSSTTFMCHFNNAYDCMGRGNATTVYQTTTFDTGKFGEGVLVDSGDLLYANTEGNLNVTQGTIEMWIKPNWNGNDGQNHVFFYEEETDWDTNAIALKKSANNQLQLLIADSSASDYKLIYFTGASTWTSGTWYHIAGTWDSSLNMNLYLDGESVGSTWSSGSPTSSPSASGTWMYIGSPDVMNGVIDEVRISDTIRSAAEINQSYQNSLINHTSGSLNYTSSNIGDGTYKWACLAYDDSGGLAWSNTNRTFTVSLPDTTAPTYSSLTESPTDPTTYSLGATYTLNATWTDNIAMGSVILQFDGANYTNLYIGNSVWGKSFTDLAVGTYNYIWYANDTNGYENNTGTLTYTINQASTNTQLYIDGSQANKSVTYGTQSNATATTSTGTVTLYRDGVVISNPELATLGANTYNYTAINIGNENYTGSLETWFLTVSKATEAVILYLNGVQDNLAITYGTQSNATISSTSGTEQLYRDGNLVSDPELATFAAGTYSYKVNTTGNANYSANVTGITYTATISKATPTCTLGFDKASPQIYGTQINASCSCTNPETSAVLYRDGTDVTSTENNDLITLGVNAYTYACNSTVTQNYTLAEDTDTFTISKAASSVNLLLDGTDGNITVEKDASVNRTGQLVSGEIAIELYQEGSLINSGSGPITNISAFNTIGTFNLTLTHAESQNYSTNSETHWVIVQDTTAPSSVTNLSNQTRTNTSIYWTWTNPADSDFSQAIVYLDRTNLANTSNSYYNATGLTNETNYTITIRTKDTTGNVNNTDVNSTALTNATPSTLAEPPADPPATPGGSSGGGSGGGGSGGGGMSTGTTANTSGTENATCLENWDCGDWSDCVESEKTRKCYDINACGTQADKPRLKKPCELADHCSDEIKNYDETDVDCGGECKSCGESTIKTASKDVLAGVTGLALAPKNSGAPSPLLVVPTLLMLFTLIAVVSLRHSKLSKKVKYALEFAHVLLIALILTFMLVTFRSKLLSMPVLGVFLSIDNYYLLAAILIGATALSMFTFWFIRKKIIKKGKQVK